MVLKQTIAALWLCVLCGLTALPASAEFIVLQSTTSTQNSGLLDEILPQFTGETGIAVRVVAVGTGQAIRNAKNGDGDVLLVHAKSAEEGFVAQGWGLARHDVMYNDFVLIGPRDDPAGVAGMTDVTAALSQIAQNASLFTSRADDSGTHKAEMRLWAQTDVDAVAASGKWYRETGSGMGATINVAVSTNAYVLSDRATWIAFGNKLDHKILVEGDTRLFNQYGVIVVNPAKHPHVKATAAQRLVDWLTGPTGQAAIAGYHVADQQLFFPNAN